jgi:hypothetical protein
MAQPNLPLTRQPDDKQANVRASEGAGTTTLTSTDSKWQIFNLSAARTVVLPSSGIKAGDVIRFENKGAFDLSFQSSALTAMTIANSSNLDPTINVGNVVFVALVDSPTAPAHWRVTEVYEYFTYSTIFNFNLGGSTPSVTVELLRINKQVSAVVPSANTTSYTNNSSIMTAGTNAPTRFGSGTNQQNVVIGIYKSNTVTQTGTLGMSSTGRLEVQCKLPGMTGVDWNTSGQVAGTTNINSFNYITAGS